MTDLQDSLDNPCPPMKVVAAFLRRKGTNDDIVPPRTAEYRPRSYELLMLSRPETPLVESRGFPLGPVRHGEDPARTVQREMYSWGKRLQEQNGLEQRGLRAKRAIFVSCLDSMNADDTDRDDKSLSMLYILPTSQADTVFIEHIAHSAFKLQFCCLQDTLRKAVRNEIVTTPATKAMLSTIDKWLREQHSIPYALQSMFLGSIRQRLKAAVISPLFMRQKSTQNVKPDNDGAGGGEEEEEGTYVEIGWQPTVWTEETFKLPDIKPKDRANLYFVNALFGTGIQPMKKVKVLVVNKYFGCAGIPDYSKIKIEKKKKKWEMEVPSDGSPDWVDEFPLHRSACEGTVVGVLTLISEGYDANQPDTDSWTPVHYAAWYGYGPVVKALIAEGKAKPTIVNENGSTALHLAASTGRPEVVQILLQNPSVNKDARDNEGRAPVDLCEECKMNDWEVAVMLLKGEAVDIGHAYRVAAGAAAAMGKGAAAAKTRRYQKLADKTEKKVKVDLLDGTNKMFALEKGNESTAKDILEYLYKEINLSTESHSIFGLWIMSPSLQWELSEDHKVIFHIRQWPQLIDQLTDGDPESETPVLCLKRTCILPKSQERKIKDMTAIHLLFAEAQHLVLSSQYPCNEDDATYLGGIAMQVAFGNHNEELHKPGCLRDSLEKFIPAALINTKNAADLEERVLQEHADISRRELDDVKLLYLLYLQQCRQWPFYGSTFFTGNIQPRASLLHRRTRTPVRVGINMVGVHIINQTTNQLVLSVSHDMLKWHADNQSGEFHVGREDDAVGMVIYTRQTALLSGLVRAIEHHKETERQRQQVVQYVKEAKQFVSAKEAHSKLEHGRSSGMQHGARGAPKERRVWNDQQPVPQGDYNSWKIRTEQEQEARLEIVRGFGHVENEKRTTLAEITFDKFAQLQTGSQQVEMEKFSELCYELGFFPSDDDISGAKYMMGGDSFNFKELVTWWSQSKRSWLFLLDDHALRQRQRATKMFRRFETSSGFLAHSRISELLDHMNSINGVTLPAGGNTSECQYILETLTLDTGKLSFNEYIDWLAVWDCIPDKAWSMCPPIIRESGLIAAQPIQSPDEK